MTSHMRFVAKSSDMTFSDAMACLRLWLAQKKLHSSDFQITGSNSPGFEIGFANERDAAMVEQFEWPPA